MSLTQLGCYAEMVAREAVRRSACIPVRSYRWLSPRIRSPSARWRSSTASSSFSSGAIAAGLGDPLFWRSLAFADQGDHVTGPQADSSGQAQTWQPQGHEALRLLGHVLGPVAEARLMARRRASMQGRLGRATGSGTLARGGQVLWPRATTRPHQRPQGGQAHDRREPRPGAGPRRRRGHSGLSEHRSLGAGAPRLTSRVTCATRSLGGGPAPSGCPLVVPSPQLNGPP
jgi:hypothetical protein